MKNIIKKVKVIVLSFSFFYLFSCASTHKRFEKDYYQIINLVIEKSKERQDSLFILRPYSNKDFKKRKKEKKIHNILKAIDFLEARTLFDLNNFLKKEANINFEKETPYFKKQIKQYKTLDTSKITLKEIRYLPRAKNLKDTIRYLSYPIAKYSFSLSKPVFTKNGKYALIDYYKHGGFYIVVYKKEDNIWREHIKYLLFKT